MSRIPLQIDWEAGVGDGVGVQFTLPGSLETMAWRWENAEQWEPEEAGVG
jgi:hypothetical protein